MARTLDWRRGESSSEPRRTRVGESNPSQLDAEHAAEHLGQLDVTQRPDVRNDEGSAAVLAGLAPSTDTGGGERLTSASQASSRSFRD